MSEDAKSTVRDIGELALVAPRAANVIGVIVRNQQGVDVADLPAPLSHALFGPLAAEAGVDQ